LQHSVLCLSVVVAATGGCSDPGRAVALRTQGSPGPHGICELAQTSGTLSANSSSGIGLTDGSGAEISVEWPYGYASRLESGHLQLLDAAGTVVAEEGDGVILTGGFDTGPTVFRTCQTQPV